MLYLHSYSIYKAGTHDVIYIRIEQITFTSPDINVHSSARLALKKLGN